MNKPARQLAALSEIRSGQHDWRYLLGDATSPCYVCGRRRKRGEGYYRLNLHRARVVTQRLRLVAQGLDGSGGGSPTQWRSRADGHRSQGSP